MTALILSSFRIYILENRRTTSVSAPSMDGGRIQGRSEAPLRTYSSGRSCSRTIRLTASYGLRMVEDVLAGPRASAFRDFAQSLRAWGDLGTRGLLASPKGWVGVELRFRDGTAPFVFRETTRQAARTDDPAVIVIQFRLAFLGSNHTLHAAFRDSARNSGPTMSAAASMRASTNGKAPTAPDTTPSAWWLCWHRSPTPARPATT